MKKVIVFAAVLTMALCAAPAFAKGKSAKKAKAQTWECKAGDKTVMTATVNECMKMGGMVSNYPGPDKMAPKATKKSKKK